MKYRAFVYFYITVELFLALNEVFAQVHNEIRVLDEKSFNLEERKGDVVNEPVKLFNELNLPFGALFKHLEGV